MKKSLLLAAALLCVGSMSAKEYVVFGADNYASLEWEGGNDGYTTQVTVDGVTFTLSLAKAESTSNCVAPGDLIKVYKKATLTVKADGLAMKGVQLTGTSGYAAEQVYSDGWTASVNGLVSTVKNADGASEFVMTCSNSQFRVSNLVVSDNGEFGAAVEPEAVSVKNVAETLVLASKTKVKVDYPLTVAYKSNSNLFCVDNEGNFIQVYGANTYANNDIIPAGWEASYELYGGATPELVPADALPEAAGQGTFVPQTVQGSDISVALVNNVVTIANVTFAEDTPDTKTNFAGVAGGADLSFRNNYTIQGVPAGEYDVTVVVTVYQGAPSLYVVEYLAAGTGVEGVAAAVEAPVYYNLQGVKVANPEKGLYVRVQGGKAVKVIL